MCIFLLRYVKSLWNILIKWKYNSHQYILAKVLCNIFRQISIKKTEKYFCPFGSVAFLLATNRFHWRVSVQFLSFSCRFRQKSCSDSGIGGPVWKILDPPLDSLWDKQCCVKLKFWVIILFNSNSFFMFMKNGYVLRNLNWSQVIKLQIGHEYLKIVACSWF